MEKTDNSGRKNTILRHILFSLLLIITFVFQDTDGFFPAPFGIHAVLLIPLTVCISMFEREFAGLFYGLAAGAFLDAFSADAVCFHTLIFTVIGFVSGALITHLMRNNLLCSIILSFISVLIHNGLYFFIFYAFKESVDPFYILMRYFLPSVLYTVLLTPIYYVIVRSVSKAFKQSR